jgi:hypothetical protein
VAYADVVLADSPVYYFRMNEPGGVASASIGADPTTYLVAGEETLTTDNCSGVVSNYTGVAQNGGSFLLVQSGHMWANSRQSFSSVTAMTLEAWVAVVSGPGNGSGASRVMFSWGFEAPAVFVSVFDLSRNLIAQMQDNTSANHSQTYQTTPGYLQDGAFHHLALSIGLTTTTLYLDGAALSPSITAVPTSWSLVSVGYAAMNLGHYNPTLGNHAGIFYSEVAFYNSALSSTRVAAHYAAREVTGRPRWRSGLPGVCQ